MIGLAAGVWINIRAGEWPTTRSSSPPISGVIRIINDLELQGCFLFYIDDALETGGNPSTAEHPSAMYGEQLAQLWTTYSSGAHLQVTIPQIATLRAHNSARY